MPRAALLIPLVSILGLVACGGDGDAGAGDSETARTGTTGRSKLDDLRALGYVEVSEHAYDDSETGVVHWARGKASPGVNVTTNRYACSVVVMGMAGKELHRWERPEDKTWSNFLLLDDGDLIVIGQEESEENLGAVDEHRYLLRLSWEGEERWKVPINAHHDVELTPDGKLAVLSFRRNADEGPEPGVELREDTVELLALDGNRLEERSLYAVLQSRPELFTLQGVASTEVRGVRFVDLIHSNSVEFLEQPADAPPNPLFEPGNVLVSCRHQDAVFIFRWETGELLWTWGVGEILGPHDATLLDNGHVLLFDNGLGRDWSRVVELDPLTNEVVWEYRGKPKESFYTKSRGSNQLLPNGNVLVCESDAARAFEVDREGRLQWAWINPAENEKGQRLTLVRMYRYPRAFFEPFLSRD